MEGNDLESKLMDRLNRIYDEYYLSEFQRFAVGKFIKETIANKSNSKVDRIREWLMKKINNKMVISSVEFQRGCPNIIPSLRAIPWWDTNNFDWIKSLEGRFEDIKNEVMGLKDKNSGFQPYRAPNWMMDNKSEDGIGAEGTDRGKWNIFYLYLHDIKYEENCEKVPLLVSLIEEHIPRHYNHALISAMVPGTHIVKHYGPTNKKLRFHLPLIGVKGSYLKVAGETRELQAGKGYVFDDSFEHEAWHDGDHTRVILIADFWHPDLSDDEVKFLSLLQKAQMKYEKKISDMNKDEDNFFNVIDKARSVLKDNEWWSIDGKEKYKVVHD